jgi:hypothetical protein
MRALNHPLKPPFQINPNISDAVQRAILKGMEMDATKRPQSVQKWLAMLPQPTLGNAGRAVQPTIYSPQPPPKPVQLISEKGVDYPQRKIPSPQPQQQPVNLISAKGVDYHKLDYLLARGEWKQANKETYRVMLKAAGREKLWMDQKSLEKFPCEDLRTIDKLWVKYSNGLFGFSVQKQIYESLGGTRKYDEKIWEAFGDRVGWRVKEIWLCYLNLKFNTKAPSGHLPAVKMYLLSILYDQLSIVFGFLSLSFFGSLFLSALLFGLSLTNSMFLLIFVVLFCGMLLGWSWFFYEFSWDRMCDISYSQHLGARGCGILFSRGDL